ncbi:MAG: glycoside hydrolase family 9 protein [Bacteroidota bacterium]
MNRLFFLAFALITPFSITFTQSLTKNIVIDQFGYLPDAKKIAVIKDPHVGFDAQAGYEPGTTFALVSADNDEQVFTGTPVSWKNGDVHDTSGDRVWHFDFSPVTTTGKYYILDIENNTRSFEFNISPSVYNEILKQAVRTFFYQRVGHAKEAQYAGEAWADEASHMGALQDTACRIFSDPDNPATERDVSGGWYDAGDYNKYTSWTANYIVEMIKAYLERPEAFTDDYNIPESGNGIPDLLDEAKWGIDHLLRLQFENGSVISIVGESHASPPSSATGQSLYGPPNTSATLNTAGALAISSKAFRMIGMNDYADTLLMRAEKAWAWADANPDSLFNNNDRNYNSEGLGAGQMEIDNYGRSMAKLEAACFLFDITGNTSYRDYFDNHYQEAHLFEWNHAYPYETENQETLLYYTGIADATPAVITDIKNTYTNAMQTGDINFPAHRNMIDPYMAFLDSYTWGSNNIKSRKGSMFYNMITFNLDASLNEEAQDAAIRYINYIHGVNPLNWVHLSNMFRYGADHGVREFYHTWFSNGNELWDRVGVSTHGPAPGFLVGGANPGYDWDGCCPSGCGSGNNAKCVSEDISPPKNQPAQKSYKDFNTSWPLNSWSVTENSCGYQVSYIRLLSKFVDTTYDCNGDINGAAFIDACGTCAGGNTGITPVTDPEACATPLLTNFFYVTACDSYTSPSGKHTWDSTGVYHDTITTKAGWQERQVVDLVINYSTYDTIDVEACDFYQAPSGLQSWTESGEYTDILENHMGCDSIITINLIILKSSDSTVVIEACDSYTLPGTTQTVTSSGMYDETFVNVLGCDSLVTYDVTIHDITPSLTYINDTLFVSPQNQAYTYQWVDCDNDHQLIADASHSWYIPTESGNYAAIVNHNTTCADTSNCFNVTISGIADAGYENEFKIYPNPSKEKATLAFPERLGEATVLINTPAGNLIKKIQVFNEKEVILDLDFTEGMYFITIDCEAYPRVVKSLVKQ